MRIFALTIMLVAVVYGRSLKKKSDDDDDVNHWVKAWLVTEEQLSQADANDVEKVEELIRGDIGHVKNAMNKLMTGTHGPEDEKMLVGLVKGAIGLAELHANQGAESIQPTSVQPPAGCSLADFDALPDCAAKKKQIGNCIMTGIEAAEKVVDGETNVINKIAYLKGVMHMLAQEAQNVLPSVGHCFSDGDDDDANHWVKAWLVTAEQLNMADANDVQKIEALIRADVEEARKALNNFMTGVASKEDEEVIGNLVSGAFKLAELHANQGAQSVNPADVQPPAGCKVADFDALPECDEKLKKMASCVLSGITAVEQVIDQEANIINKVAYLKGAIHMLAKEAEFIVPAIDHCFEDNDDEDDDDDNDDDSEHEHWIKTWMVTEEQLKMVDANDVQKIEGLIRRDVEQAKDALQKFAAGVASKEDEERIGKLIEGAFHLAELHAEKGAQSVIPADVQPPAGCKVADFQSLTDCDAKKKLIGNCVLSGITAVEKVIDEEQNIVNKIAYLKGAIHMLAEEAKMIIPVIEHCFKDDDKSGEDNGDMTPPPPPPPARSLLKSKSTVVLRLLNALRKELSRRNA